MAKSDLLMGEFLSARRKAAGISQKEMASRCSVLVQQISNIERNISPAPSHLIVEYMIHCKITKEEILTEVVQRRIDWCDEKIFALLKQKGTG